MKRSNCAIYTRKSSDEGLEKEFNSLDAQREACEAYILSQKHAGWVGASRSLRRRRPVGRHDGASGPASGCSPTSSPARFRSWSSTRSTG